MSIEAMNWVYKWAPIPEQTGEGEPSPATLTAVLLCMADAYNDEAQLSWRGKPRIAAYCRLTETSVRRALRALEVHGLIECPDDQDVVAATIRRADRRTTGYRLCTELRRDDPTWPLRGVAQTPRSAHGGSHSPPRGVAQSATGGRCDPRSLSRTQDESKEGGRSPKVPSSLAEPASSEPTTNTSQCPQHPDGTSEPCAPCAALRVRRQQQDRAAAEAVHQQLVDAAAARSQEVTRCTMCDADGYVGGFVCDHDPDTPARAARGSAACRAALVRERVGGGAHTGEHEVHQAKHPGT